MQKWEYMFVRTYSGKIVAIDDVLVKTLRPSWKTFLKARGLEGWELASEVSFAALSVHATLKRPIPIT